MCRSPLPGAVMGKCCDYEPSHTFPLFGLSSLHHPQWSKGFMPYRHALTCVTSHTCVPSLFHHTISARSAKASAGSPVSCLEGLAQPVGWEIMGDHSRCMRSPLMHCMYATHLPFIFPIGKLCRGRSTYNLSQLRPSPPSLQILRTALLPHFTSVSRLFIKT